MPLAARLPVVLEAPQPNRKARADKPPVAPARVAHPPPNPVPPAQRRTPVSRYSTATITAGEKEGTVLVRCADCTYPECYVQGRLEIACEDDCTTERCGPGSMNASTGGGKLAVNQDTCERGSGHTGQGGVAAEFRMGHTSEGKSAGRLYIHEDLPNGFVSTPRALRFTRPDGQVGDEVHAVRYEEAEDERDRVVLKQVKAPHVLADVVYGDVDDTTYEITFYATPAEGWVWDDPNNQYVVDGYSPFLTYVIESVDGPPDSTPRIAKYDGDSAPENVVAVYDYSYIEFVDLQGRDGWTWTLAMGDGQETVRTEAESWTDLGGSPAQWERTRQVAQDDGVTYKLTEIWQEFSWGNAVIERVVDPDGDALTTTFEYYDSGEDTWGRLKSVSNPDGSWAWYDYEYNEQDQEWITAAISAWKDQAPIQDPSVDDPNAQAVVRTYDSDHRLVGVTEYAAGEVVSRTEYSY